MKKNVWNQMKLFILAGLVSLTLLGCGGTKDTKEEIPEQEEQAPLDSEDKEAPQAEKKRETSEEGTDTKENADSKKPADDAGAQSEEEPIGEITDLGDGRFTIKKFYQETLEDGSGMLVSPAEGAEGESEMEQEMLTVLCDEDTRIYKRTIRDGGASYEDTESAFENLEKGMEVNLKGNYEEDGYRATEVQIVDVVL